jgi:PAS domain S-box-containing protein
MMESAKSGTNGEVNRFCRKKERPRPRRRAAPDAAVEELRRLARISEESPDPVFRVSAEHVLLYHNPAGNRLCRGWGCRRGQKVPEIIRTIVSAALADGTVAQHEITFDSRTYWLTVAPAVADGYVNIYARETTEHRRSDEARRQAEQRFRVIFDNTSDGIFLFDLEARKVAMCNQSCRRMLGYTEEELLRLGLPDLHPAADLPFIEGQIEEFLKGGRGVRRDIRFRRKDGSIVFVDLSPDLIMLDGRKYILVVLKDITERKRTEEALRQQAEQLEALVAARTGALQESERRYRSLAENAPDIIQRLDRELRHLYVNAAFARATGLPPAAVVGKTDRELGLPADLIPVWEKAARTVFRTGRDQIIGFAMTTPEGRRYYEAHLVPEFAADGSTEYVLAITRDITARKQAEEALRFTQFAIDHTADAAFWMTEDARFFYVNEAACQALGYSREELLQRTVYDIDPAFTEDMWRQRWCELKAKKNIVFETVHRTRDGRVYPVEIRANYLEFGGREYDCAFARDITERKQAEEALRFTQFAIDHTADAAFWMTEDARFFYVNEAACQALGYSRDELLQLTLFDIDPAFTESMWRDSWRRLKAEKSRVFETVHRARDGRTYPVEIRTNYLEFGGREYHCAFARDITERKQAEEALRRLNEDLELQVAQRTEDLRHTIDRLHQLTWELSQAEDRERRRIADILHDDVQQTLAAVRFHVSLLGREPRSPEESRALVEQVKQMLRDVIEKTRSLSHELSPALYQVDLVEILAWLARHMQQKHGLRVHLDAHGPVGSPSESVRALLYKVAQELLFNVVKHAGVDEARVRLRRRGPCLYLSVADRGRGFDPEKLAGTAGLGLCGIRERVRLLGGRMKITARSGWGSRFLIVVPDQQTPPGIAAVTAGDTQVPVDAS